MDSCSVALLPYWWRVPAPLPYILKLTLPISLAIIYLNNIALSPANCKLPPGWQPGANTSSMRQGHKLDISYYLKQQERCRKFLPAPLSFVPTILQLCQMPHVTRRILCGQNALAKEHYFAFQLLFPTFFHLKLVALFTSAPPTLCFNLTLPPLSKAALTCSCAIAYSISFHYCIYLPLHPRCLH